MDGDREPSVNPLAYLRDLHNRTAHGTRIPAQALRLQIDSITGIDMTLPMLRTLSEDSAIHFLLGARTTLPQSLAHADSTAIKREVIIAMNSFLTTFTEVHPAAIGFV